MPEFLLLQPPAAAWETWQAHFPPAQPRTETVAVPAALGRVSAGAVAAPHALPQFARSAVDGYAVRACDLFGASDSLPAYLALAGEVLMGDQPAFSIGSGQAGLIHTGGMLPAGADAVVMVEQTQVARPGEIEVLRSLAPGDNVIQAGEDVAAGEEILSAGRRLTPAVIGGLLALGIQTVTVTVPPRIAILSSGDEVIPSDQDPRPGQVRDINSPALAALVVAAGGQPDLRGLAPDRIDALQALSASALAECDALVITAGSSASVRDLTAQVVNQLGQPGVLVHGINIRPGKPTILGVCAGKPVIGLPGNPVSALVVARLFVTPLVEHLLGLAGPVHRASVAAVLTANLPSQAGREDWAPVRLLPGEAGTGPAYLAEPIFYKSNLIFNLARADGLVRIPPDDTGLAAGTSVVVELL